MSYAKELAYMAAALTIFLFGFLIGMHHGDGE